MLIGLGNPGKEYENTRHNFGFMLVDELLRRADGGFSRPEKLAAKKTHELWRVFFAPPPALPWLLLKPLTYMNNSGQPGAAVAAYYNVEPADILVAHDELDLPLGSMRLKFGGGSAGHKGINSLTQHLGTRDFYRLRLGIGKNDKSQTIGHVLGHFGKEEGRLALEVLDAAARGVIMFDANKALGEKGFAATQEFINGFSPAP